jgi:cation diffusion facilitator family transporter
MITDLIVLWGLNLASRPADENHHYGHGKLETLASLIVAAILLTVSLGIMQKSFTCLLHGSPHLIHSSWVIAIALISVLLKEILYRKTIVLAKSGHSPALEANAWHHRSDAITSIAAFVGISIAIFGGKGFEVADDYAALLAAVLILYNCYKILRPALGEVMDENIYEDLTEKIRLISVEVNGVKDTEKCFIRKAGMKYHVDLHAIVDGEISVKEGHHISHQLKDRLCKEIPELGNVLIHVEPFVPLSN